MSKKKIKPEDVSVTIAIPLYVYPVTVVFSFNTTDKQVKDVLIKNHEFRKSDFRSGIHKLSPLAGGKWAYYRKNICALIRMHTIPITSRDYGILAHEIFHVVAKIMESLALSLQMGVSDEAYAYLTSYITEHIYKELNKYY